MWEVLRNPSYRKFWMGSTFSYVGDAMTNVALVWLVYQSTNSPTDVALLLVCYTAPVVVGGLVAGHLLDRFDKRTLMIADNSIRGVTVASLPILYFLGLFFLWEAFLVALVYGFFYMITLAGAPSILPDLVDEKELTQANALETVTFTVSGVLGPPLAGVIIVAFGAQSVMLVDAASYASLVAALAGIKLHPKSGQRDIATHGGSLRDAVALLTSNKVLLSTTLMFMSFNFANGMLSLFLPIFSKTILGGGAELYGLLLGVLAVGSLAGAMTADLLASRWSLGKLIISSQMLSGAALAILLVGQSVWILGVSLALLGYFGAPQTAWAQTLRMKIIPAPLRGRTFALLRTLMLGGVPAGSGAAGAILPSIGLIPLVGVSVALIGLPGLAGSQVRDLRQALGVSSRQP